MNDMQKRLARVERAIRDLQAGRVVIVTDDKDRENEGDFIALADRITGETVNLIISEGRGLLCQAITAECAAAMRLAPMQEHNTALHATAFTVSVDAVAGCTTGISAFDRAITIRTLADPSTKPEELARPGHIFPLVADSGGLACRRGHTEAAIALAELCAAEPSAVLCEILDEDGRMARGGRLRALADRLGVAEISIQDIVDYESYRHGGQPVAEAARAMLPTRFGRFQIRVFTDNTGIEHEPFVMIPQHYLQRLDTRAAQGNNGKAVQKEDPDGTDSHVPLVRIHSECLTGECLSSLRCDCRPQLEAALERVQQEGGVVVYLRQEGRGIGLTDKIRAYALQDAGLDTYEANTALGLPPDARSYEAAAEILKSLGLRRVRVLSNNPDKIAALEHRGIAVVKRIPLVVETTPENREYIQTKQLRFKQLMEARDGYSGN